MHNKYWYKITLCPPPGSGCSFLNILLPGCLSFTNFYDQFNQIVGLFST